MSSLTVSSLRPSTFSIVACDLAAGEWGVAVQSKFLAVGAVVPWARAGVGAILMFDTTVLHAEAALKYAVASAKS